MRKASLIISLLIPALSAVADDLVVHHDLDVRIDPLTSRLEVRDTVSVPETMNIANAVFSIHEGVSPRSLDAGVRIVEIGPDDSNTDKGMDQEDYTSDVRKIRYRIEIDGEQDVSSVSLAYAGEIHHPVQQIQQEYARGFSQSPGIIGEEGVYLAGATHWIPSFGDEYVTYEMRVSLPPGWTSVSQGTRLSSTDEKDKHEDAWKVDSPTEEIFVIAAEFFEYEYAVGDVMAMAFLRTQDDGLANKYLETTAQYLEMYEGLLGPYPYSKFALVENFWETGYGMPSFTLLGSQVIRFPFILHSSYPHELLHNWWGNGVYVEFETGNWCEGLTTYMADHLVAEQRGTGADYRRTTLQGYTDYVTADNTFPLSEFLSRTNASSSSIGYGKTAMMWDMLRVEVGDDNFAKSFQKFYRDNQFRRAGFDDIRAAFEDVTGRDLSAFFEQWVTRSSVPSLSIADVTSERTKDGHEVRFSLSQTQDDEAYMLKVPVAVITADEATLEYVEMTSKRQSFAITATSEPLRIEVDPEFNLMRRLDYREIPPSLSKIFGAEKVLMILPAGATADELARYEKLAEIWKGQQGDAFEVRLDTEVAELPADRGVWVLGWDNRWRSAIEDGLDPYDSDIGTSSLRIGAEDADPANSSLVVVLRHPANKDLAMAWLTAHDIEAVSGLARKLPHYGKYSYLGFTGTEPTNSLKGQWPAVGSPMVAQLAVPDSELPQLSKRPGLATLAPVFNAARMKDDVAALTAEDMQGRGVGTTGIDAAADYIAAQFAAAGLKPAGDDGTWFQAFTMPGEDGEPVTVRNVLGVIPGKRADWNEQSVVVSAHYDHLGFGWPGAAERNRGQAHPGADDNASGVAVMLELARTLAGSLEPARSVIFAAFTAEESGLLGARHYVANETRYPVGGVMGNLNIDTVGRLGENKLLVLDTASAREWKFIFMGASYVTGVPTETPTQALDASDQVAFVEAGVPGVQFFAAASPDYHKPTDTAEKLDFNGMVKVASIVREGIEYLAERPEPLSFQARDEKPKAASGGPSGGRRVSTGIVPDFAHSGAGMAISDVGDESPAAKAGLGGGDVVVAINGEEVADLRSYSEMLKQFSPGDVIEVTFERDGQRQTVNLTLRGR